MDETKRLVWPNPVCADVNSGLQEYTSVYIIPDQYKDSTRTKTARQQKDINDTQKLQAFRHFKNPFDPHVASLQNIDAGVIADESANVENTVDVGKKIVDGMIGYGVLEYVFRKKEAPFFTEFFGLV